MPLLDKLERSALFRLTRLLALFLVFVLFVGLIFASFAFANSFRANNSLRVSPDEVIGPLKHPSTPNSAGHSHSEVDTHGEKKEVTSFPGLKIPFSLQPYFSSSDFRQIIQGKISGMDAAEQQGYLDNLGELVVAAKQADVNLPVAVEAFLAERDAKAVEVKAESERRLQERLYAAEFGGSALGLVGLFSLILVLLAIERNTRTVREEI